MRSALIIGLQGIRARKLRTLLSMISLFLGVLAVVIVQASAEAANRLALADSELTAGKDGTLRAYLPADRVSAPIILEIVRDRAGAVAMVNARGIVGEPRVTPVNQGGMSFEAVQNNPPGMNVGPPPMLCGPNGCVALDNPGPPQPPGMAVEVRLTALTADIRQFRPFRLVSGQWLDFTAAPSLSPGLVLNREAARFFGHYRVPAELRIDGAQINATPRIVGVVDDGMPDPAAYVRADELFNWLPQTALANTGMELMLAPAAADAIPILKARLAAAGAAPEFPVETIDSRARMDTQLVILKWIFFGLASLVLLIGVAGILNVGLATVGERVEEFALRRAVGTPRTLLAGIVLAETLITGLLTAGAAIGAAALGLHYLGKAVEGRLPIPLDTSFPWQAGVAGVIAGLVAGLLGGLIPAIRAARIPIASVMRA